MQKSIHDETHFFLEPSPEELENFFSGQVIGLLFRQAAYEFELARHASRIQTLEQTIDETRREYKKNDAAHVYCKEEYRYKEASI